MSSKKIGSSECIECGVSDSKYKCPKCYCKYCSVTCCKKHKESCTQVPISRATPTEIATKCQFKKNKEEEIQEDKSEIEDKVPDEKLALLEQSDLIRKHLENPHLRRMLQNLDSTNDKTAGISQAMQEPIFTEFADACLGIVDVERKKKVNILKQHENL